MGMFDPTNPAISATDDENVAKAHGLTYLDEESGQYRRPREDESENAPWLVQTQQRSTDPAELQPGEDAARADQPGEPVGLGVHPLGGQESDDDRLARELEDQRQREEDAADEDELDDAETEDDKQQ